MADEPITTQVDPPVELPDLAGGHDAAYWKKEAEKAFAAREKARQAAPSAEVMAEYEQLKAAQAQAEEDRQRKAGEFDAIEKTLKDQNTDLQAKVQAAQDRYIAKEKETAFRSVPDLFGPSGLTTLTPEFAFAGMASYVTFVPGENGTPDRLTVTSPTTGEVFRGADGRPLPFADGMRQLIDQWPNKESILRSGLKAGSGSTGGTGEPVVPLERRDLAERAMKGDSEALAALRTSKPPGTLTRGAHWDKKEIAAKAR